MGPGSSTLMLIAVSEDKARERDAEQVDAPTTQRDDGETMEALPNQTQMDPKLWNKLEEDLVEEIITRLPLKNIVQSQVLAKKWRSRFQSSSFQQVVSTFSSRWEPSNFYHPLWLTEKGLCGYDRSSQKWKDLCPLLDFPADINETASTVAGSKWRLWGRNCFVFGALVFSGHLSKDGLLHMFVTNVINKTARRCPPVKFPQRIRQSEWQSINIFWISQFHVHLVGHHHYKLVMVTNVCKADADTDTDTDSIIVQLYDSKLNSWTKFKYEFSRNQRRFGNDVYLRGVIYVPCKLDEGDPFYWSSTVFFLRFDVDKGLFGNIIPPQPVLEQRGGIFLAWRSQLLRLDRHAICMVNLQTLELTEILKIGPEIWRLGPAHKSNRKYWGVPGIVFSDSDSDCIHLILEKGYFNSGEVHREFFDEFENPWIDKREVDERMILVSCDLSKRLLSHSLMDNRESGHNRDKGIKISKMYKFQPDLSPFVLA